MGTKAAGLELEGRWSLVRGTPVYHRAREVEGSEVLLHLHGFAISGSYMVPTAQLLADEFTTYVPDLPGFGRSPRPDHVLTIPELADSAAGLLDALGVEKATVVGNSLGCTVLAAFAQRHPDRLARAVMVSPAGGVQSQPLPRAIWQLLQDTPREPPSMATVAVPDYVSFGVVTTYKLFVAMTQFPAFQALIAIDKPLLAVLGVRDPLLPPAARIREVVQQMNHDHLTLAVLKEAAHAINYSHPRETADLIRAFMRDEVLRSDLEPADGRSPVAVISKQGQPRSSRTTASGD
ncbi:MAG: alpha/beta fold hydrolase [Candidatus Nanopelagicales bacterium]